MPLSDVRKTELSRTGDLVYIRGDVNCGIPVVGADIRVYDTAGTLFNVPARLQSAGVKSGPLGAFLVAIESVPDRFRVVALDARCEDSVAELKAEVRDFDPAQDIVHISPVSTLLANHIDRFRGQTQPARPPHRDQAGYQWWKQRR